MRETIGTLGALGYGPSDVEWVGAPGEGPLGLGDLDVRCGSRRGAQKISARLRVMLSDGTHLERTGHGGDPWRHVRAPKPQPPDPGEPKPDVVIGRF